MCHEVAADKVFLWHGIKRQPGVLNCTESQKDLPTGWHLDAPFDALTFCPDAGDRVAAAIQSCDVGIANEHQPFNCVLIVWRSACLLRLTLRETRSLKQQLHSIEFIQPKEACSR